MTSLTQFLVRTLQKMSGRARASHPAHLALGARGETEAYFYLRGLGYRIVATNFRVPNDRGEIDLIGWEGDVLCFIEVKTRSDDSFAPPSTAVTEDKQKHILSVARRYLRHLSHRPRCRFDIVSIVPSAEGGASQFTLRRGAFTWEDRRRRRWLSDFIPRAYQRR